MTSKILRRDNFRIDINGLRAWAVVAVVLYHFGIPGFGGGFIGVDVFFVISGFLMTGIVVKGLERAHATGSSFSAYDFWLARARRIIPALAAVCVALLIGGWFFLTPTEYEPLGKHVLGAITFTSNIAFWRESGYFDSASHEKWLLHTWSLSAEWQFYVLLPLALMLLWRLQPERRAITGWLIAGFAASLALSIFLTPIKANASFYLLPTRAWEMLAGGLVFMFATHVAMSEQQKKILDLTGISLILGAAITIPATAIWPGWLAVIPTTGTVLVLLAARSNSPWTSNTLAQQLGNASYSIYLWHWPIVVALAYLGKTGEAAYVAAGITMAIALGHLSWRLIEQPAQKKLAAMGTRHNIIVIVTFSSLIAALGAAIYLNAGIHGRLDEKIERMAAATLDRNPRAEECLNAGTDAQKRCTYGGQKLGAVVIGDSHAASIVRTIEKAMGDPGLHVLDLSHSRCPTLTRARINGSTDTSCRDLLQSSLADPRLRGRAPILIINRTTAYVTGPNEIGREAEAGNPMVYFNSPNEPLSKEFMEKFREDLLFTACEFAKLGPTYMLRPIPEMRKNVPKTMSRAWIFGHPERISITLSEYHERHAFVWKAQDAARDACGIHILDPLPYLCSDGQCWGDINDAPLYYDDDHLSEYGASMLLPLFQSMSRDTPKSDWAP